MKKLFTILFIFLSFTGFAQFPTGTDLAPNGPPQAAPMSGSYFIARYLRTHLGLSVDGKTFLYDSTFFKGKAYYTNTPDVLDSGYGIANTEYVRKLFWGIGLRDTFSFNSRFILTPINAHNTYIDLALLPYSYGGTGATSFTNHGVVVAGASALLTVAPGTTGNTLTSNGTDWVSSAPSGGGVTTMAAIGASPNANGATISGSTLNLQPASASFGGVVTTGAQAFAGQKTIPNPLLTSLAAGATAKVVHYNTSTGALTYADTTVIGATGWDDMLARAQAQTVDRDIELSSQQLTVYHSTIGAGDKALVLGPIPTIQGLGSAFVSAGDSVRISALPGIDTSIYKPIAQSPGQGGLVRMTSWPKTNPVGTANTIPYFDGAGGYTTDLNSLSFDGNTVNIGAGIGSGGLSVYNGGVVYFQTANGDVYLGDQVQTFFHANENFIRYANDVIPREYFILTHNDLTFKFSAGGGFGKRMTLDGANFSVGDIQNTDGFPVFNIGDDSHSKNYIDNAAHNTTFGINTTTPAVALDVVGDVNNVGNVGIGTSIARVQLDAGGAMIGDLNGAGNGTKYFVDDVNSNNVFTRAVQFSDYGAGAATFDASGNITSVSDPRLKNIINTSTVGLKEINRLTPILFKWKPESKMDTVNIYAGFNAQNVKDNIPYGTGVDKKGYLSLQDRAIMAAMVNAIKELSAKVDAQAKEIKKLKYVPRNKHTVK